MKKLSLGIIGYLAAMVILWVGVRGLDVALLDAATLIQMNTTSSQNVSNKTFDSTNTYNGTFGTTTNSGAQTFSSLTANSIPLLNGSKQLVSTVNPTNGQLLIGSTGVVPVLGSLAGTANQIIVTPGAGTVTLSTPQNIHTGASPTFNALTLTTPLTSGNGGIGTNGTPTNGQLPIGNGAGFTLASITGTANRVTVTAGAGTIALNGPQDLHAASTPTFAGATYTGAVTSSKACVGGYTRKSPNFCSKNGQTGATTWTDATTCTGRTTGDSLPPGVVVELHLIWQALANSGIATRTNDVTFYNSDSCIGNLFTTSAFTVYEHAAVAASTVLARSNDRVRVPLVNTDLFYATQTNAGGNGNADVLSFEVLGYYD